MDKKESEEICRKVETKEFLRETFDYDERGFLTWKEDRSSSTKAGMKAGCFDERKGFDRICINSIRYPSRRLIWIFHQGPIPSGMVVKSINGNKRDTRIENLKLMKFERRPPKDRSIERDAEELRRLFSYDSKTGKLSWKNTSRRGVKDGSCVSGEQVRIQGVLYITSRICYTIHHDRAIGDGLIIDHINGNHLDNRIYNLREVTPAQNTMNSRLRVSKKSGFPKGVSFQAGKYKAQIKLNKKTQYLGSFPTIEEAFSAYQEAAKRLFGEFACFDR